MDDVAEVRAAEHHGKRAEDLRALRGDDPRHHRKHTDGAEGNDERHHALDDRIERGDQVLGKLALFARGKDAAYIDTLFAPINNGSFVAAIAAILVCAVLGGLFGQRMMKKHFEKAGIVA